MSNVETNASPAEARARNRRRKMRRQARAEKAARHERIFDHLVRGMPHVAIARFEKCSVQQVRKIVARELAGRRIDAPADFAKLQIARLNEALMAANGLMIDGDASGVDRLLKVVAQLDRYHGLAQAAGLSGYPRSGAPLLGGPQEAPPALPAPAAAIDPSVREEAESVQIRLPSH